MGSNSPNSVKKAAVRPEWNGHRRLLVGCVAMVLTLWFLPIALLRTESSNGAGFQPPIMELSALEEWPTTVLECRPLNLTMSAQGRAIEAWQDNQKHSDLTIQLKTAQLRRPFTMALPAKGRTVVADMIQETGSFAPEETLIWYNVLEERCKQLLPDGRPPLVVDVGVNVGYFSMIALSLGCRVVGFEPQSFLAPYLATTLSMQPDWIDRFTLLPCGAGARPMSMDASAGTDYGLSYLRLSRVGSTPVVRLDEYVKEDVLLLKVDTEGFEQHVLAGMDDLLADKQVENVLIEVKPANRPAVAQFFRDKGFNECRNYWERYWKSSSYSDDEVRRVDFERLPECKHKRRPKDESEDFWYRRVPAAGGKAHGSRAAERRPAVVEKGAAARGEERRPAAAGGTGGDKAALLGKSRLEGSVSRGPAEEGPTAALEAAE